MGPGCSLLKALCFLLVHELLRRDPDVILAAVAKDVSALKLAASDFRADAEAISAIPLGTIKEKQAPKGSN